jgi:hypothetical protein
LATDADIFALSGALQQDLDAQGWQRVWPAEVAAQRELPVADVLRALAVLEAQGLMAARAQVRCANGHGWAGAPSAIPHRCPVCEVALDEEAWVEVVFEAKKKHRRRTGRSPGSPRVASR